MLTRWQMLTTKKRSFAWQALAVISLIGLTACGPPGPRDLRKGERLIQSRQFAEAITVLEEGRDLLRGSSPTVQAHALNLLGMAYEGAGQSDPASRAYLEALKFDRNLWVADYNLGCLRLEESNYVSAIDYLSTYTTSRPRDTNGFLLLGRAYFKLAMERTGLDREHQMEFSERNYDTAEKLHPSAEARNAFGLIELTQRPFRNEHVKASMAYFRQALEVDPHYGPALLNLAVVEQYAKEPHDALQTYHQYLDLKPAPPQASEVERIVRQLEIDQRITIMPAKPEQRPAAVAPTNAAPPQRQPPATVQTPPPVPTPKPAPAPTPTPAQTPAPPPQSNVRSAPKEKQPVTVAVVERPAEPPAKTAPPGNTTLLAANNVPPANPAPPVVIHSQPVEAPPAPIAPTNLPEVLLNPATNITVADTGSNLPPEKKAFLQKFNPLHWLGKPKKSEAGATPPANADGGDRYTYPVYVTPIPGDRKLAEKLTAEGRQAEKQSNRPEAIWDYQEAIKADPTYFESELALGLTAIDAKDYPGALQALGQALTLQANSSDARYAFAWVLGRQGYYQDAANELVKLLSMHPGEVRARLLLGNYYADNLNDPKLAREQYLKALDLIDSQSSQASLIRTWLDQHP